MLAHVALTLLIVVPPHLQQPPTCSVEVLTPAQRDERALAEFKTAIDQYVSLHRRLARWLPPEDMFTTSDWMAEAGDALAEALRDARPQARIGNIFSIGPAQLFRGLFAGALPVQERDREALAQASEPPVRLPEVNGRFDWSGAAPWPALRTALPPLPPELEYRIVGRDLVLIDRQADLVVDILENALPEGEV